MAEPVVIAHRGVPGERLEHTLSSYELAIAQGADHIEPDVVCTRDGHLVVRHENEIGHTTDVAQHPELADRRATKIVDGLPVTGWFVEDLTLEEVKTLRVRERLPQLRPHNLPLGGTEQVLTLNEVLDVAAAADREVGVYAELKHPSYFREHDLDLAELLVATLERRGLAGDDAPVPVVVQARETRVLRDLRTMTTRPLLQLLDRVGAPWDLVAEGDGRTFADLATAEQLAQVATWADAVGPNKSQVIGRDERHRLTGDTGLVDRAHAEGLLVHVWTMRDENNFLPRDFRVGDDVAAHGDAEREYLAFYDVGVDGVFTDFTRTAVAARAGWSAARAAAPPAR